MSSKAKRVKQKIVQERIAVACQVLSIVEEEAHNKGFFARLIVSLQYLFTGRIDVFFKVGKKNVRKNIQDSKEKR